MNHVHERLLDSTRELAHLWPLVHLVVELAERRGQAVTLLPADPANGHLSNEPVTSSDHSKQGLNPLDRGVSDG